MGALSNNIMGGQPDHPWFHLLTDKLIPYNWNWILPYIIVSYATGQWFVTDMFERYHSLLGEDGTVRGFEALGNQFHPLHRVLMSGQPGADPWVFFTQTTGDSWVNWDNWYFHWVGDHVVVIVMGVAVVVGLLVWRCCACARKRSPGKRGYRAVPENSVELGEVRRYSS